MPLAATRPFQDLRPLVLGNHALELEQQLILGGRGSRRADKQGLDTGACELLDQQDLIGVSSTQTIWRVDQYSRQLTLGGQVAHPLQARTDQTRATIAFVLEHPLRWNRVTLLGGKGNQRCRLAGNGVLLLLLVRRNPGVDCRRLH